MYHRAIRPPVLSVAVLLLVAGLAGCLGSSAPAPAGFSSFQEAMGADGKVVQPNNATDSPIRLKLLEPSPTDAPQGKTDVALLLYDGDAGEPVTDASMRLAARMPAMGHGTNPEEDPTHQAHGIYVGMTNFIMGGQWLLKVDADADGTTLDFDVPVAVAGAGGGTGDGGDTSFDSFDEAVAADGKEFGPVDGVLTATQTFEDSDIVHPAYGNSFDVTADAAEPEAIEINASMTPGTGVDSFTFTLHDPDGNELASLELTADQPQDTVRSTDLAGIGTYGLNVSGNSVQGAYSANVTVEYPGEAMTLKLLDPGDPSALPQGKQPLQILLYDATTESPIPDAEVSLASWMPAMGHGTEDEEDPSHQGEGIYKGKTNHIMGGKWIVNLDAELPSGLVAAYEISFQVDK